KTKEELNALKEEYEALNHKLAELTEDELESVSGGLDLEEILEASKRFFKIRKTIRAGNADLAKAQFRAWKDELSDFEKYVLRSDFAETFPGKSID
ncbi:MAG: hypothetical protein Q4F31_10925, partial [Eubacteriales bacterium]|nr:hypothetical protein [Eubacteriales bacterium]